MSVSYTHLDVYKRQEYGISAYSIYQLDLSDNTDDLRFMSLDWVQGKGLSVDQMCIRDRRNSGRLLCT